MAIGVWTGFRLAMLDKNRRLDVAVLVGLCVAGLMYIWTGTLQCLTSESKADGVVAVASTVTSTVRVA
eukprot:m.334344 g.334344  ORF g.334344 m.334344 type:complete len:68 (-) comp20505_c0_seq47:1960-2163(-)